jgi:hypothetical protein
MGLQGMGVMWMMMLLVAVAMLSSTRVEATGLKYDFYKDSCPKVEHIVYKSMKNSYDKDHTVAPGVLRLIFHDCFVRVLIPALVYISCSHWIPSSIILSTQVQSPNQPT